MDIVGTGVDVEGGGGGGGVPPKDQKAGLTLLFGLVAPAFLMSGSALALLYTEFKPVTYQSIFVVP
jgi:hypothetical protein